MAIFQYRALDTSGKEESAKVTAESRDDAMQQLAAKNLVVLDLTEAENQAPTEEGGATLPNAGQVSNISGIPMEAVLTFYEQMGFLINSGIPIFLAVKMVGDTLQDKKLVSVTKKLLYDLSEGALFSTALQRYPKVFPKIQTSIIAVGEKTGQIDQTLEYIVELVKEQQEIRSRFVKAASYPIFLMSMSSMLVLGMLVVIFPKFKDIFDSFGSKLPASTQFFMDLGMALSENFAMFAIGTGGAIGFIVYLIKGEGMADFRDSLLLKIPLISDIYTSMFVALFTRTLGSLLKSGIPLLEGLKVCRQTMRGGARERFLNEAIDATQEGESLSRVMERQAFIPELAWQLVAVGEKTGELSNIMDSIFSFYKRRYIERLTKLTAVLGPIFMFGSAGLIGAIALSLFLPLFKLGSTIKRSN